MDEKKERRIKAIDAVNSLSDFMRSKGVDELAKRYEVISKALQEKNIQHAVSQEGYIPQGGMGSLTDLYISKANGHNTSDPEKDNALLMKYIEEVSHAFAQLRKQLKGDM